MRDDRTFAERLSPDTVARLERAAEHRFASAELLRIRERRLAALYFYGYSAEMYLCAAYFRNSGFQPQHPIDRDTRQRRMAQARQLRSASGAFLMSSDPHPLVGWARFLQWQRSASSQLSADVNRRLEMAVNRAIEIYHYWRPELRYKVVDITESQLAKVRAAATWFKDNHSKLTEP